MAKFKVIRFMSMFSSNSFMVLALLVLLKIFDAF